MRKNNKAIDGFVPRYAERPVGGGEKPTTTLGKSEADSSSDTSRVHSSQAKTSIRSGSSISRQEIDDQLRGIDDEEQVTPKKRRLLRKKPVSTQKKKPFRRKFLAIIAILIVLLGGFFAAKALIASGSIFKGNFLDILQNRPLKMDANGRSNVLVLGSTDDDPDHPGNYLTDTVMVVSIDQNKKNAFMFSLPRDLWVDYNMSCDSGYQGKLNVYFSCVSDGTDASAEQKRLTKTKQFVGDIVGLDIQYAVHVNSVVVKDAVNAVGGIDVDIQGSGGAPGILDRNFDWRCKYKCNLVKYDNGVHHLDGDHAMYLTQARGDTAPTYGLGRSNFDREVNQQKVMMALQKKAVSSGTLANPLAVSGLLDAFGNNLRSNFESAEIQTLVKLGKDIPSNKIQQISLVDEGAELVVGANIYGQSAVQPAAGLDDYSDIQAHIKKQINASDVTREKAKIAIFNGSGITGYAKQRADALEERGFTINAIDNAPNATYKRVELYVINKKPATVAKLETIYGVKASTAPSPISVTSDTDVVLIFGPTTKTTQ